MAKKKKYWAFVSYSSKDERWGKWLHKKIENYRIPKELQGTELADGEILGSYLRPIFRDRDELSGSEELGVQIREALGQSRYLIVLCSPNSAQSQWVNKEIEFFRVVSPGGKVLALILDGEPNATTRPDCVPNLECFPPSLRLPVEPLAGDLRKQGDGKERGLLKILAGVAQVGFDELYSRHLRAQRRALIFSMGIASFVIAMLVGLSIYAYQQTLIANAQTVLANSETERAKEQTKIAVAQRKAKERALDAANAASSGIVSELVASTRNWPGLDPDFRMRLLIRTQNVLIAAGTAGDDLSPELRRQLGIVNSEMAITSNELGRFNHAISQIDSAQSVFRKLYEETRTNESFNDWMIALRRKGEIFLADGQYQEAIDVLLDGLKQVSEFDQDYTVTHEFHTRLGLAYQRVDDSVNAHTHFQSAYELLIKQSELRSSELKWIKLVAAAALNVAIALSDTDPDESLSYLKDCIEHCDEYEDVKGKNRDKEVMDCRLQAYSTARAIETEREDVARALAFSVRSIATAKIMLDSEPQNAGFADELADQLTFYAMLQEQSNQHEKAVETYSSVLHLRKQIIARAPTRQNHIGLVITLIKLHSTTEKPRYKQEALQVLSELEGIGVEPSLLDSLRNELGE